MLQLEDDEVEETCRNHVIQMKKEMVKTSGKNYGLVSNLMTATFKYRRQKILTATISVENVLEEYPALQLVSEVCLWY